MKTPRRLEPLIEDGLIDEVVRPLMSGKEASVYVVRCGDSLRCAKVYKVPKCRPCSVSLGPVCGCRSPMISSMACC